MLDNAKMRFSKKRVHHPGVKRAIQALKTMQTTGATVTYIMYVNQLSMELSQLPQYLNNNSSISALSIGGNP